MPLEKLGRYEIIRELGHGAMGVVYKARDPLIDRIVAIKTIALDLSNTESVAFEQRFYREARSAGRLNHSNIVTIHDVGKSDTVAYIAMEFLDGQSLREILDSGVVLPPEKIVDIVAQVADGLAFAHDKGIVHRDIKPSNVMVLDSGLVKITDFGIALLPTGSRTVAGNVFGSPKYMSPEQVMGRTVNWPVRHFFAGHRALRDADRLSAVPGGDLNAVIDQVVNADARGTQQSQQRRCPGVRPYRRQGDGKESGRSIPRRAGDGDGTAEFPRSACARGRPVLACVLGAAPRGRRTSARLSSQAPQPRSLRPLRQSTTTRLKLGRYPESASGNAGNSSSMEAPRL